MRILLLSQFFGPDSAASGQLLGDAAHAAAEAGHEVRVICGRSDYTDGQADYREKVPCDASTTTIPTPSSSSAAPVKVTRVGIGAFSHGKPVKLLSFAMFFARAAWNAKNRPRPDLVLTLPVPPGLVWIGWLLQRVWGCRHVVLQMDVYPDIAVALGMPVLGWFGLFLDYPLRRAGAVIALGDCMKQLLLRHGI